MLNAPGRVHLDNKKTKARFKLTQIGQSNSVCNIFCERFPKSGSVGGERHIFKWKTIPKMAFLAEVLCLSV